MKIIPCTEATFLISKRQDTMLNTHEAWDLIVHLFVCKFCRRFLEQTRRLVREFGRIQANESLTSDEKRKIQEILNSA